MQSCSCSIGLTAANSAVSATGPPIINVHLNIPLKCRFLDRPSQHPPPRLHSTHSNKLIHLAGQCPPQRTARPRAAAVA